MKTKTKEQTENIQTSFIVVISFLLTWWIINEFENFDRKVTSLAIYLTSFSFVYVSTVSLNTKITKFLCNNWQGI